MQVTMSSVEQRLEEELAKIDPETLEKLLVENEPAERKIVQNVLDEPISQEMDKRMDKRIWCDQLLYWVEGLLALCGPLPSLSLLQESIKGIECGGKVCQELVVVVYQA